MTRALRSGRTAAIAAAILYFGLCALAPTAAAQPAKVDDRKALELFEQGFKAYQEGRFQQAIDLLEKAYAMKQEPVLLYNLARAHEGVGNLDQAISMYERYLNETKDVADRAAIEKRVETMRGQIAERDRLRRERDDARKRDAQAPPGGVVEPPKDDVETRSTSPLPWIVGGVGAAGLIAGGVLTGLALGKHNDAEAAPSQREAADLQASAESLGTGGTIALIAGGGVLGIGVIWGILDLTVLAEPAPEEPQGAAVRFRIGPTGGAILGRF
jgi:tetratricopeptide (TPR) repeat protein